VRRRALPRTSPADFTRARYNSFAQYHLLSAQLRQKVSPDAAAIALEAILRRDRLEDRARVALFDELAAFFQSSVQFPAEYADQLSSEQYVRNIVELLYT
jgi:hypothetical protein